MSTLHWTKLFSIASHWSINAKKQSIPANQVGQQTKKVEKNKKNSANVGN